MTLQSTILFPEKMDAIGAYTSQTFTSSGTFTAPSDVPRNLNGKVEVYVTATAAGGKGGAGIFAQDSNQATASGGQAGQWCRRFKVELDPGEEVTVTVPGVTTSGNGASFTFGTYITLSGGLAGAGGLSHPFIPQGPRDFVGTSGTIVSGSVATDNAIHSGARGGGGARLINNTSFDHFADPGGSNMVMGAYEGGALAIAHTYRSPGSGGAGLFGNGGDSSHSSNGSAAAANSGGGGGGGGNNINPSSTGGDGAAGQCLVEWRLAP